MYIITGFGRSGTSFVAEMIQNCGIYMGEYIMSVDAGFEHPDIVLVNKTILSYEFRGEESTVSQMKNLAERIVIAKDPRFIFTLGSWILHGAKIDGVFVCKRAYEDMFKSSERTQAGVMSIFNGFAEHDKICIAEAIMNGFLSFCSSHSIKVFPIHFPQSLEDFNEVSCLSRVITDLAVLRSAWQKTIRKSSQTRSVQKT